MADDLTPEAAVRLYLMYLADPAALRDQPTIDRLKANIVNANDPIDRLKAVEALRRAEAVDGTGYEKDFISLSKAYAQDEGISAEAFQQVGVPDDILVEAGFDVTTRRGRGQSGRRSGGGGQRAKSVPVDEVKRWVRGQRGTFLLSDVMRGAGGSPATVRKAVEELVVTGEVERIGPVANHDGRGRAPIQYARG